jgi:hypothetical protein
MRADEGIGTLRMKIVTPPKSAPPIGRSGARSLWEKVVRPSRSLLLYLLGSLHQQRQHSVLMQPHFIAARAF